MENNDPRSLILGKIEGRWILDINVKAKTINLPGVNTGKYLFDLGVGKAFLQSTEKTITIKENLTSLKLRSSAHQNVSL